MALRLSHLPQQFEIVEKGERCVLTYTPPTTEQRLAFQMRGLNLAALEAAKQSPEDAIQTVINSISKEKMINSALDILINCEGYEYLEESPDGEVEHEGSKYAWTTLNNKVEKWETHLEVLAGHHLIQLAEHVFGHGLRQPSALRVLPKEHRAEIAESVEDAENGADSLKKK